MRARSTLQASDLGLAGVKIKAFNPQYATPEQILGSPGDARTDTWSQSVSILEMLAGEVTWADGSITTLALKSCLSDPDF